MENMKETKILVGVALAILVLSSTLVSAQALKPGIDFSGGHFNLNLIGKKSGWSGGGSYDNPDRHTIFVPQTTGDSGIKIWMTQGSDFAVLDGDAVSDGEASFQLGPGHYNVYVAALAKPGGDSTINGWVYDKTTNTYYLLVGTLNVGGHSGKPQWKDATSLFYYEGTWILDYLAYLSLTYGDQYAYLWQYINNGDKLVQVRFYAT